MLHAQRKEAIVQELKLKEVVSIQELVDKTGASESTIRRDLNDLESDNFIKRVHGGASLSRQKIYEPTIAEKEAANQPEKYKIAEWAASMVKEKESIFLDAGTTTLALIPFLENKQVTVVTNGITHVPLLLQHNIPTYVTGGRAKPGTAALAGEKAASTLREFRFDTAFVGINGIHPYYGYSTPDPDEALVKHTAISYSTRAVIIADHSKIYDVSFANVGKLSDAQIVTSSYANKDQLRKIQQETRVKVVEI